MRSGAAVTITLSNGAAKKFCGLEAAVPCNQGQRFVHEDGGAKTTRLDAVRDLTDLRLRMRARVTRVGLDVLHGQQAVYTLQVAHRVLPKNVVEDA